jgi:hypothetical protein
MTHISGQNKVKSVFLIVAVGITGGILVTFVAKNVTLTSSYAWCKGGEWA